MKLTVCNICHKNMDDYVELETSLLFVDCLLLTSKSYRHLINSNIDSKSCIKLGFLLLAADTFCKWSRWQKEGMAYPDMEYAFYTTFGTVVVQNLIHFTSILILFRLLTSNTIQSSNLIKILILSSLFKLMHVLTVVWDSSLTVGIDLMIDCLLVASQTQAIRIASESGYENSLSLITSFAIVLLSTALVPLTALFFPEYQLFL